MENNYRYKYKKYKNKYELLKTNLVGGGVFDDYLWSENRKCQASCGQDKINLIKYYGLYICCLECLYGGDHNKKCSVNIKNKKLCNTCKDYNDICISTCNKITNFVVHDNSCPSNNLCVYCGYRGKKMICCVDCCETNGLKHGVNCIYQKEINKYIDYKISPYNIKYDIISTNGIEITDKVFDVQIYETLGKIRPEQGGILLGCYYVNKYELKIKLLITFFFHDKNGNTSTIDYEPSVNVNGFLSRIPEQTIITDNLIGLLHSHPPYLDKPSNTDIKSITEQFNINTHFFFYITPIVTWYQQRKLKDHEQKLNIHDGDNNYKKISYYYTISTDILNDGKRPLKKIPKINKINESNILYLKNYTA